MFGLDFVGKIAYGAGQKLKIARIERRNKTHFKVELGCGKRIVRAERGKFHACLFKTLGPVLETEKRVAFSVAADYSVHPAARTVQKIVSDSLSLSDGDQTEKNGSFTKSG